MNKERQSGFLLCVAWMAVWAQGIAGAAEGVPAMSEDQSKETISSPVTLTVLYNNVSSDPRLQTAWGMSCLVEGTEKTILFDTGGDGEILLSNMEKLGKRPGDIDMIVLSHIHGDHTGGLHDFLQQKGDVGIYVPESFPRDFERQAGKTGATVVRVDGPVRIEKGVYSTGQMGMMIREQALILRTGKGLVIITGCAHPGVVDIVKRAKEFCEGDVYLVFGGFHLMGSSERGVRRVIAQLRELGVRKAGPSHCTGEAPIAMFREAWGDDFIDLGCGASVVIDGTSGAPAGE